MKIIDRMRSSRRAEGGSALVAAMGVALIGVMFSLVVVAVAIMVTRDSARDRIRTTEIHAAESALDTAILALSTGSPCVIAPITVGSGPTAVNVAVTIEYFDKDDLPLTACAAGKIVGAPTWARVTAVGTQKEVALGIDPKRTIQAKVNLVPIKAQSSGSAIYSAGSFSTGAGFSMGSVDPATRGRVWINSGNWTCNTSITIDGDLVVPAGGVQFSNATCTVKGNLFAKSYFNSCCTPSSTYSVWGDVTVWDGGMTLSNKNRFGGKVSVKGTISTSQPWSQSTVVGAVCSGSPGPACTSFQTFDPIPMPVVNYVPAEWPGFAQRTKVDIQNAMISSWLLTQQWQKDAVNNANCSWPAYLNDDNAPNKTTLPVNMPAGNAIYDLRGCAWGSSGNLLTLKINADTAIFSSTFSAANGLKLVSGDGLPHHVYLIVPVTGPSGYTSGNITFTDNGLQVDAPLDIFVYTPKALQFPNTSTTRGQLYAGSINVGAGSGSFLYTPVPVPSIWFSTSSTTAGYDVQVVNKNED